MQAYVRFATSRKIMVLNLIAANITESGIIEAVDLNMDEFDDCREELRLELLERLSEQGATDVWVWFSDEIGTDKDPIAGPSVEESKETLAEPPQKKQPGRCFPEVKLDVLAENARKYDQN